LITTVFTWPKKPTSETEFESLMSAVDAHLASQSLTPFQRPLNVPRLFWEAFSWEGSILPPDELADQAGYDGEILMAKAHRWYTHVFGEKLNGDWVIGYAAYALAGTTWKVRFPVIYGQCRLFIDKDISNRGVSIGSNRQSASYNIICSVEALEQGLATRLSAKSLEEFWTFYTSTYRAFEWRKRYCNGHDLFGQAESDYASSVDDLLNRRYAQSRWASSQAVEKMLKAILAMSNVAFPKGGKDGHNLIALSDLLYQAHGAKLRHDILNLVHCSPAVRYGEESTSKDQAITANHSVLGAIEMLIGNRKIEMLLSPNSCKS